MYLRWASVCRTRSLVTGFERAAVGQYASHSQSPATHVDPAGHGMSHAPQVALVVTIGVGFVHVDCATGGHAAMPSPQGGHSAVGLHGQQSWSQSSGKSSQSVSTQPLQTGSSGCVLHDAQFALPAQIAAEQQELLEPQLAAVQGQHIPVSVSGPEVMIIPSGQRPPLGPFVFSAGTHPDPASGDGPASLGGAASLGGSASLGAVASIGASASFGEDASGGPPQAGSLAHAGSAQSVSPLQSLSIPSVQCPCSLPGSSSPAQGPNRPNSPF